jgi:hypothetical protein
LEGGSCELFFDPTTPSPSGGASVGGFSSLSGQTLNDLGSTTLNTLALLSAPDVSDVAGVLSCSTEMKHLAMHPLISDVLDFSDPPSSDSDSEEDELQIGSPSWAGIRCSLFGMITIVTTRFPV